MSIGTQRLGAVTALILAGAVAGCSDDPAPTDAGQDVVTTDLGGDTGGDAPVGADRPDAGPPADTPPRTSRWRPTCRW